MHVMPAMYNMNADTLFGSEGERRKTAQWEEFTSTESEPVYSWIAPVYLSSSVLMDFLRQRHSHPLPYQTATNL